MVYGTLVDVLIVTPVDEPRVNDTMEQLGGHISIARSTWKRRPHTDGGTTAATGVERIASRARSHPEELFTADDASTQYRVENAASISFESLDGTEGAFGVDGVLTKASTERTWNSTFQELHRLNCARQYHSMCGEIAILKRLVRDNPQAGLLWRGVLLIQCMVKSCDTSSQPKGKRNGEYKV